MKEYRYIEIKEGNEYHALVDSSENIYNEKNFFYPVYEKSARLVKEICKNSSKELSQSCREGELEHKEFSNNIIMFCAERGGGKSTAMLSFANALKDFRDEYDKHSDEFVKMWGKLAKSPSFLVLNVIDPTEISESDLFLRIVFSKMFSLLRDKWKKDDSKICSETLINGEMNCKKISRNNIIKKFTECYRYLDVIYQKKGQFEYDDDLDDLTDLGDSGKLREKFWNLVNCYLKEMTSMDSKENDNFLVIQIDDADLNSVVTYKMIEDIRKYCIIPNVIILMSINITQMHHVLEQNFVSEFKTLLEVSKVGDNDGDARSIHLRDCQRMAMRYIDKVMPAAHQIHLPKFEDFINYNTLDLKIIYNITDKADDSKTIEVLTLTDNDGKEITDYQEISIQLIYKKTGIVIVKPDGYLHNILPKTMRGLSHFLAYMCQLPDLDKDLGIAEINELLNEKRFENPILEIKGKHRKDAEAELHKRVDNLEALRLYFLKNWCTVRLSKRYQEAIEDINKTVVELKVKAASSWIDRLFEKEFKFTQDDASPLSSGSYAFLRDKLQQLALQAYNMDKSSAVYHFVYALRFYFLLEFNQMFLSCVQNGGNFNEILRLTNCEMWAPSIARLDEINHHTEFGHFKINYKVFESKALDQISKSDLKKFEFAKNNLIIIRSDSENYFCGNLKNVQKDVDKGVEKDIGKFNAEYLKDDANKEEDKKGDKELDSMPKGDKELDSMPGNAELIFDLGSSLLYRLINDQSYNEDTAKYYSNLNFKNCLIALLSSWELQRYAEKMSKYVFHEEYDVLGKAHQQFIYEIFEYLNKIKYLPIEWDKNAITEFINSDISLLMFANKGTISYAIRMLFKSIQDDPYISTGTDKLQDLRIYMYSSWNYILERLCILSNISEKAEEVYDLALIIQKNGAAKDESQESSFQENRQKLLNLISDNGVLNLIIKQAEEWFDKMEQKSDDRDKPEHRLKLIIDNDTVKDITTQVVTVLDERKQQANSVQETKPVDNKPNNSASNAPKNINMADKQEQSNNTVKKPAVKSERPKTGTAVTSKTVKSSKTDTKKSSKK